MNHMINFNYNTSQRTFILLSIFIIFFSVLSKVRVMDKLSIYSDYDEYYTASTFTGYFDPEYIKTQHEGIDLLQELNFAAKHAFRDFGNSALYNFVGIICTRFLQLDERGMRYLSLVFYLLSIMIFLKLFNKFNIPFILRIAGIFILCYFSSFSQFSVIIRTYSFSVFSVMLLTYYVFVRCLKNHFKTTIISALLTITVFFSHFLTVFALLIIWVYLIIITPKPAQSASIRGITFGGIICVLFCLFHWDWITHFLDMNHEIGSDASTNMLNRRSAPFSMDALFLKSLTFYPNYFFGGNSFSLVKLGSISSVILCIFWIWFSIKNRFNHFIILYNIGGLITFLLVIKGQHFLPFNPKYNIFYFGFWVIGLLQISQKPNIQLNRALLFLLIIGGLGNAYKNWKGPYPKFIKVNLDGQAQTFAPQQSSLLKEKTQKFIKNSDGLLTFKNEEELCLFMMLHGPSKLPITVDKSYPTKLELPGFPKYYGPY